LYGNKYKTHSEAVVISCFFNPQRSEYRLKAFNHFYDSIKHLNHHIVECVIGDDEPQLPTDNSNISLVRTKNLLWHKESLLNKLIDELPEKYKYILWVDADVIFTNLNWVPDAVKQLQENNIVQLFEFCTHLDRDQLEPINKIKHIRAIENVLNGYKEEKTWRSFAANYVDFEARAESNDYDYHGHVGFAWGAKRSALNSMSVPLYDRALIGGADHIIAHACAGHIPHSCITKSFKDDIEDVNAWSREFYRVMRGKLGYVSGNLYHIWHGDIKNRQYLKRIVDFTPKAKKIKQKDSNGLYMTDDQDTLDYMAMYFLTRENTIEEATCINPLHNHNHSHDYNSDNNRNNDYERYSNQQDVIVPIVDTIIHETHHSHESHHSNHDYNQSNNDYNSVNDSSSVNNSTDYSGNFS
jgi:hypothetical protein